MSAVICKFCHKAFDDAFEPFCPFCGGGFYKPTISAAPADPPATEPSRCDHDTNGDGDCGRPMCPICSPGDRKEIPHAASPAPLPRERVEQMIQKLSQAHDLLDDPYDNDDAAGSFYRDAQSALRELLALRDENEKLRTMLELLREVLLEAWQDRKSATESLAALRAAREEAERLMTQVALIVENAPLAHKPESKYDLAVSLLRAFLKGETR